MQRGSPLQIRFWQNGLRGAYEFCTHTRHTRHAPPTRQARELGKGKRTRGPSFFSPRYPPSASQLQLAEGVEFIEKYAHLDHLEAPIWRTGWSPVQTESCGPGR